MCFSTVLDILRGIYGKNNKNYVNTRKHMKKSVKSLMILPEKTHVLMYLHIYYDFYIMAFAKFIKTNEKNIYSRTGFSFQVYILRNGKKFYETFSTLEEAIKGRDAFLLKISNNQLQL